MATLTDWIETLDNYHVHGYHPGDCGRALLANDLFGFMGRADEDTIANILPITRHIYNRLDARCWGSYEKVDAWILKKRKEHEALKGNVDAQDKDSSTAMTQDRLGELIEFWDEIGQQLGAKSRWSMLEEAGTNPDEIGIHGTNLTLVYTDHWGKAGEVKTAMPDNPTWRQMYIAADKVIQESGDEAHIFIELFTQDPNDPNTYLLDTGS